jgi:hypothetical protein
VMQTTSRRGHGDDSVYYDHRVGTKCSVARHHKTCSGRWRGVISLGEAPDGKRLRRKVSGQTRADVRDKLRALHEELSDGLHTSHMYSVRQCVEDWLDGGLDGRSAKTVSTYREVLEPLVALIGSAKLRTADEAASAYGLCEQSTRISVVASASACGAIRGHSRTWVTQTDRGAEQHGGRRDDRERQAIKDLDRSSPLTASTWCNLVLPITP